MTINDLSGRLDNVVAIILLGQKFGCDVSHEALVAAALYVPQIPMRYMK